MSFNWMVHNKKTKQVKLNVNNNPNKQKTHFKTPNFKIIFKNKKSSKCKYHFCA